jgi:hypothetical protein
MLVSGYFLLWVGTISTLAWLAFGLPVWLVLGTACWFANRRSRLWLPAPGASEGVCAPEVTPVALAAKVVAFSIIVAICSYALLMVPWAWFTDGPAYRALFLVIGVLAFSVPMLLTVLMVLFAVLIVDLLRKHRLAGRDTAIAYGTVIALQVVASGLALTSGFFGARGMGF